MCSSLYGAACIANKQVTLLYIMTVLTTRKQKYDVHMKLQGCNDMPFLHPCKCCEPSGNLSVRCTCCQFSKLPRTSSFDFHKLYFGSATQFYHICFTSSAILRKLTAGAPHWRVFGLDQYLYFIYRSSVLCFFLHNIASLAKWILHSIIIKHAESMLGSIFHQDFKNM